MSLWRVLAGHIIWEALPMFVAIIAAGSVFHFLGWWP